MVVGVASQQVGQAGGQLVLILRQVADINAVDLPVLSVGVRVVHAGLIARRRGNTAGPCGNAAVGIGCLFGAEWGEIASKAFSLGCIDLGLCLGRSEDQCNGGKHPVHELAPCKRVGAPRRRTGLRRGYE